MKKIYLLFLILSLTLNSYAAEVISGDEVLSEFDDKNLATLNEQLRIIRRLANGVHTTNLNNGVVGTLDETNGGTGQTTVTQGDILYGSAANTWSKLGYGTSGYCLKTQGVGANPIWAADNDTNNLDLVAHLTWSASSTAQTISGLSPGKSYKLVFSLTGATIDPRIKVNGTESDVTSYALRLLKSSDGTEINVNSTVDTSFKISDTTSGASGEFYITTLASDTSVVLFTGHIVSLVSGVYCAGYAGGMIDDAAALSSLVIDPNVTGTGFATLYELTTS